MKSEVDASVFIPRFMKSEVDASIFIPRFMKSETSEGTLYPETQNPKRRKASRKLRENIRHAGKRPANPGKTGRKPRREETKLVKYKYNKKHNKKQ
jgi:hypothetical protein